MLTVGLPTITISTGVAPQSATWSDVVGDCDSVSFILNGTTTAPGILVQGALTTDSAAVFVNILRPVDSTAPSAMVATSSGIFTIWPAGYRQIRFTSTGLVTAAGGIPIIGAKLTSL